MTASLHERPLARDTATDDRVALNLHRVTKSYETREVLHGVDLTVAPGEFVAIVGRSGCGKSTLLRLVAGLEPATGGEIVLNGKPVDGPEPITRMMFQDARLLPWKRVRDNVRLGLRREDVARADRALEQVGLADRANDWPLILSGGQKQRVALARALASEPGLLLLDEPLGALDALTRLEMQRLLETLWQARGFTTLLVTHDVEEAVTLADRVILIEQGTIAGEWRVPSARPRLATHPDIAMIQQSILARLLNEKSEDRK